MIYDINTVCDMNTVRIIVEP